MNGDPNNLSALHILYSPGEPNPFEHGQFNIRWYSIGRLQSCSPCGLRQEDSKEAKTSVPRVAAELLEGFFQDAFPVDPILSQNIQHPKT